MADITPVTHLTPASDDAVLGSISTTNVSAASEESTASRLCGPTSRGSRRMQIIRQILTLLDKWLIFASLLLFSAGFGTADVLRGSYQAYAVRDYAHSTVAAVTVLRHVISAPTFFLVARLADVFEREALMLISVVIYVVGTILDATCKNVFAFYAGVVMSQIGQAAILLLIEVIVADLTPLRDRLFFSVLPLWPSLVNTWISSSIAEAAIATMGWRWAIGMWAFIVPVVSVPLLISLRIPYCRAVRKGLLSDCPSAIEHRGIKALMKALPPELSLISLSFATMMAALIIVTVTIAGDATNASQRWRQPDILVPLLLGAVIVPVIWTLCQRKWFEHDMLPMKLLRRREIWAPLGTAFVLGCCFALQAKFLYNLLVVAYNEDLVSATRVNALYLFTAVLTGVVVGCAVRIVGYLKPFIILGAIVMVIANGVLIHASALPIASSRIELIAAQVLVGISWGLILEPGKASIQAASTNEHLAVLTALYMASHSLGLAIGHAVSGVMWTQLLMRALLNTLPTAFRNLETAEEIYKYPAMAAVLYTTDPTRNDEVKNAINASFCQAYEKLVIAGLCLCILLVAFTCCLGNPKLGDQQSIAEEEEVELSERQDAS